ncbi:MAG: zinc-dependent peptidase [Gemmataceae bacterium]|nr:zinc-dependent peptidase [Gemmataceae bacterium]MCI0739747.1 zinc-dependent peptidase [Gemmataceae bacterium]
MLPLPPPPEPPESTGERSRPAPPKRPPVQDPETFPKEWRAFLKSNVYHYQLLSKAERRRLRNDTRAMIAKKDWEGCGGLSVTDEIKVTIAAQACLMLLGQEHDYFGHVRTILIYPSSFQASDERWEDEGWLPEAAGGQAVYRGPVILSWDTVLAEGRAPSAGANLVIHEFAHQLDFIDGYADGTLDLQGEHTERWQEVLNSEYNRLRREIRQGHETFLGDYAATSKTEFFATASERFFTQPAKLRHFHPELSEMLSATYAVDPERWFRAKKS